MIKVYIDSWNLANTAHGANNFNAAGAVTDTAAQKYDWLFLKVTDSSKINVIDPFVGSIGGRFLVIDDAANAGVFGTLNGNPYDRPMTSAGQGTFKVIAGDFGQGYGLYIHYSAIPEPSSVILAGLASLGAGWYGRRKMKRRQQAETPADAVAEASTAPSTETLS
jgi:hypothetical protein